jgi:large subunit ribosomal protein L21
MYAIIDEGGRQYKVTSGDILRVDREAAADEKTVTFDRVLLVAGGGEPKVGQPLVGGATVTADVIGEGLGAKVIIGKYKRRKGYHHKAGHRQRHLKVRISAINV